jgi:hypothetical protein
MEIEIGSSTWRRGITLFYFLLRINKMWWRVSDSFKMSVQIGILYFCSFFLTILFASYAAIDEKKHKRLHHVLYIMVLISGMVGILYCLIHGVLLSDEYDALRRVHHNVYFPK